MEIQAYRSLSLSDLSAALLTNAHKDVNCRPVSPRPETVLLMHAAQLALSSLPVNVEMIVSHVRIHPRRIGVG